MTTNAFVMNSLERRATLALASVYAARMLGLFLILPVFALYAQSLSGGQNAAQTGFALGVYGAAQALLLLPLGWLSDRVGRKPVIAGGLLVFTFASLWAAQAASIESLTLARALQGAAAVSSATTALLADLTREQVRTKAMALIGLSIGVSFAASLILSPLLAASLGAAQIFNIMAVLAALALLLLLIAVPNSPVQKSAEKSSTSVWRNPALWALNGGVLVLHACLMALFFVIPLQLKNFGFALGELWQVYLPALILSLWSVPLLMRFERQGHIKKAFLAAIVLLICACGLLLTAKSSLMLGFALCIFFAGFNALEASQPSLVSKLAPPQSKGSAMGLYNTLQAIGLFLGAAVGGWLYGRGGAAAVYTACGVMCVVWLGLAKLARYR